MNKDMNRDEAMAYMAAHPGSMVEIVSYAGWKLKWEDGILWYFDSSKYHEWRRFFSRLNEGTYQPYTPKPAHKALCYGWDDNWFCVRDVGFYNKKYDCFFGHAGSMHGAYYDHYEEMPRHEWPVWAVEQYDKLED